MSQVLLSLIAPHLEKPIDIWPERENHRDTLVSCQLDKQQMMTFQIRRHLEPGVVGFFKVFLADHPHLLDHAKFDGLTLEEHRQRHQLQARLQAEDLVCFRSFSEFSRSEDRGDFAIVAETGERFAIQSWILADRSPVFAAMLETDMLEKKSRQVLIKNYPAECLQAFVDLLHGKLHRNAGNHLRGLIELFDAYQIENIVAAVGPTRFKNLLTRDSVPGLFLMTIKLTQPAALRLMKEFIRGDKIALGRRMHSWKAVWRNDVDANILRSLLR